MKHLKGSKVFLNRKIIMIMKRLNKINEKIFGIISILNKKFTNSRKNNGYKIRTIQ